MKQNVNKDKYMTRDDLKLGDLLVSGVVRAKVVQLGIKFDYAESCDIVDYEAVNNWLSNGMEVWREVEPRKFEYYARIDHACVHHIDTGFEMRHLTDWPNGTKVRITVEEVEE